MLLEFRVANYKSFKEETVFSMVASKDTTLLGDNTIETGLAKTPYALKSAAIYGANASGKSNLLEAMRFMRDFVNNSFREKPDAKIKTSAFKLRENAPEIPSFFEMTFLFHGTKYQYSFEVTTERVISEQLFSFDTQRPKTIFTRLFNKEKRQDDYDFPSNNLKGEKLAWQLATRNNALFLSTAIQFKGSDALNLAYDFFEQFDFIFNEHDMPESLTSYLIDNPILENDAISFIKAADTGIDNIIIERENHGTLDVTLTPKFIHKYKDSFMELALDEQSIGTQTLYKIISKILGALDSKTGPAIVIIDELDRSLHPSLVRKIVELFHNPEINKNSAQLIFTTHDVTLLNNDYTLEKPLFRRDQIWFTEKDQSQETKLTPLLDFSPRANEPFEKWYLQGRYGGVPFLKEPLMKPKETQNG